MTSTILSDIESTLTTSGIGVMPVQFPMAFSGVDEQDRPLFRFANDVTYPMHELGAGYISERFKQHRYAECTRLFRDEKFIELASITENGDKKQVFQAALFDNAIVGIMANYNPIPHHEILTLIKSAKLEEQIAWWRLTPTELEIGIRIAKTVKNGILAALQIKNGHSGHFALKYQAAVRVDDYEWTLPVGGKRRHLSKVRLAMDSLDTALQTASELKMEDRLKSMSISDVKDVISMIDTTARQDRLVITVLESKPANASEFVASMGVYASTVGYSSAVHGLLDPILDKAAK